ncbi:UDP-N-acetylenolpyruvoylglucosamine reductase [bacterium HR34]|nr:UDP-N-acetylenolpyruvoylglucosamine reductase [bacterium HR34]
MAFENFNVKENYPGKNLTTIKVGGPIRYFFEAKTKEDLLEVLKEAKRNKIKFYIIGSGSNLLIKDEGFDGLLIKILFNNINFLDDKKVFTDAGVFFSKLVDELAKKGIYLKFALGIPGTIGGAVYGNSGGQTEWIGDFVEKVFVIDTNDFQEKILTKEECNFSYRKSIFHEKKHLIITGALFNFENCNYKKDEFLDFLKYRRQTQPLSEPSFGSTFRGVSVDKLPKDVLENIVEQFPEEKNKINEFFEKGIVPAGWMIEKCGLKNFQIGGAKFSEKHSNFIVNVGNANFNDVISLINLAKQKAKEKFNIDLETEVQII